MNEIERAKLYASKQDQLYCRLCSSPVVPGTTRCARHPRTMKTLGDLAGTNKRAWSVWQDKAAGPTIVAVRSSWVLR